MSFLGKFSGMIVRCVPTKEREESHHEKTKNEHEPNGNAFDVRSCGSCYFTDFARGGNVSYGTSCQHCLCSVFRTMVFAALCDDDRGYPDAVHGNPAACSDRSSYLESFLSGVFYRASHGKIFWCCWLGRFSEQESSDHLYPIRSWHF